MKLRLTAFVVTLAVVFATCKYELPFSDGSGGNDALSPGGLCHPDTVYFVNTILPLISSGCAANGCHDPDTREGGLVLNTWSGIRSILTPGRAAQSTLYAVITTNDMDQVMPPPPHTPFAEPDIAAIDKWISQGAKNNRCISGCDSAHFSWTKSIRPIMEAHCKSCHNVTVPGGGIDLSTYAGVRAVALSGELVGSIRHTAGFEPMPGEGARLEECQIKQIEKWMEAGMPAN